MSVTTNKASKISREAGAALAGISLRHLFRLEKEADPPPWAGDGYPADLFGAWLARRWRKEMGVTPEGKVYDYETERARLTKAQADRTELEAKELQGQMVQVEVIIAEWSRMLGAMRQRLLSIPTKSAPRVRGAASDITAAALLEAEIIDALGELSDDGLDDRTRARRERSQPGDPAAAETHRKRVGRPRKATLT